MKGAFSLAIYVAIGITGAAFGQTKVTTTKESFATTAPLGVKSAPLKDTTVFAPLGAAGPIVAPPPRPVERVVMTNGQGGRIVDHRMLFVGYCRAKTKVNSRPLLFGLHADPRLSGAGKPVHRARRVHGVSRRARREIQNYMVAETRAMYETYPPEIRRWIDHNGGWQNLPIDGFWTMYDHSLWALGYPRCAP